MMIMFVEMLRSKGQREQRVGLSSAHYSLARFTKYALLGTGEKNFIENLYICRDVF